MPIEIAIYAAVVPVTIATGITILTLLKEQEGIGGHWVNNNGYQNSHILVLYALPPHRQCKF